MSVSLQLRLAILIDGNTVEGSLIENQTISLTAGQSFVVQDKTVADDYGEDVLWTTGDGGLDSFTHGFFISTQDVWLQLRNDDTGTVEYVRIFCPANTLVFVPAKIAGNTTDAFDGVVLVDNTDYADTDQIEVCRDAADAVGDAVVSLYLFA